MVTTRPLVKQLVNPVKRSVWFIASIGVKSVLVTHKLSRYHRFRVTKTSLDNRHGPPKISRAPR